MLLTGLLLISMVFVATTLWQLIRDTKHEQEWVAQATVVQVSSQQLAKSATEAAGGNLDAFNELSGSFRRTATAMSILRTGNPATDLPPVPGDVALRMHKLNMTWDRMSKNTTSITEREALLLALADASSEFSTLIPGIQENSDRVARQLTSSGAPNQQVFAASRQQVLADRMLRHVTEILQGGGNAISAADKLNDEIQLFGQVLTALRRGNQNLGITQVRNQQALASLARVNEQFGEARPHLQTILDSSSDLFGVRGAADEIFLDSQQVFDQASDLAGAIANLSHSRTWPSIRTAAIGLVVMIALMALVIGSVIASERRRATVATSSNRRNQKAILTLLDELGSVADGDLTVSATVSNEMTGAIADAINYAIERLRDLVMGINETANSVANSAQVTHSSTAELAQAAEQQATQIDSAAESVQKMSGSFDEMAERSMDSSEAAQKSVEIAHSGADKVRETISGMETIREQIQQTSKRIKRLGESIQEIGDIVSLINGIAEQTNVLALNAAIQAASAGEAGKGFAVVADEVQQLSESATNATKRIESLVQTIQADASGAVDSMETTTTEVVGGTRLAEDAGTALAQIENVSNSLSDQIQSISGEAQAHSAEATRISEQIHGIRNISKRTLEGTQQTARVVEELAELVLQLRESVADFKLPEQNE